MTLNDHTYGIKLVQCRWQSDGDFRLEMIQIQHHGYIKRHSNERPFGAEVASFYFDFGGEVK